MATVQKQIPSFFKCFNDVDGTKKLDLPELWCSYMGRSLPFEAILRNKYGDSWEVKIAHYQNTDKFWFEDGWRTFAEQNKLICKDHILCKFDGKSTFDFQLFDENGNEKEYVRISKSEEEMEEQLDGMHPMPMESEPEVQLEPLSEEQQHQTDPKEQQDMQSHLEIEPQPEERQEVHPEPEPEERQDVQPEPEPEERQDVQPEPDMQLEQEPGLTFPESEYSPSDREDEDFEVNDDFEDENTRSGSGTVRPKRGRAVREVRGRAVREVREADEEAVFQSGFPRPTNPYFVTKRRCKRNELYVPTDIMRDFNIIFPEEIVIQDEQGRKWSAKVCKWKDRRLWLSKGWKSFCKWNHVRRDDWCIIEIMRPETPGAEIFLKTHLVPAALRAARRS